MLTACCDIGGTNTQAALVDDQGNLTAFTKKPTDTTSAETVIGGAIELLKKVIDSSDAVNTGVRGIGVAVAGLVRRVDGAVIFSPNLPFRDTPLKNILAEAFKFPVLVDNDANLAALGENRYGAGRGAANMVMLTIGTGIGGGVIINGHIYRGADGSAGELGHMSIDRNGPICGCGNRGCLEAIAGGRAIAAEEGQREDVELAAGEAIGIGLANIINIFNPEIIVLGGGVIEDRNAMVGIAAAKAKACALSPNAESVRIVAAALGNQAGLIGAGVMLSEE